MLAAYWKVYSCYCFRHSGGHVRLGRITVPDGRKHLIAPRVHHQRRDADSESLPTPATGMNLINYKEDLSSRSVRMIVNETSALKGLILYQSRS
jgi:hypothetical protein